MTSQLPMFEVIATARQKLSGVSACLNDSQKFSSSLLEFDLWLSEHIQAFSEIKQSRSKYQDEIEELISIVERLENQARYNVSLVEGMQHYVSQKLNDDVSSMNSQQEPIIDMITRLV